MKNGKSLKTTERTEMPRNVVCQSQYDSIYRVKLHGFSNKSPQNYGTCICLTSVLKLGKVSVYLVGANSRLPPLITSYNSKIRPSMIFII